MAETPVPIHVNEQLPTPPDEPLTLVTVSASKKPEPSQSQSQSQTNQNWSSTGRWPTPQSESSSISTSPPPLDEADSELPSFAESQFDEVLQDSLALDPLVLSSHRFDLGRTSPTSSNEVEIDSDDEPGGQLEVDSIRTPSREEVDRATEDEMDPWNT